MSDSQVLAAQRYLNSMFGGHPSWVRLDEDGATGTKVMEGIIKAFQIQNGVSSVTGTVGPLTIQKMKDLPIIQKMDPNAASSINVCLIQCALFCKGYNAGGITGVYYTTGVAAVEKMQSEAGLIVNGKIDWKVWSGLLSMNWFQKVSGGDSTIRLIQQQLNGDWSDIIGVGPCDGVVSRQTALSLVGALQGAEGVTTELITDLNSVNFGEATTDAFPNGGLKNGQNNSYYMKLNKIAQYGLYFNGYNPGRFDGIFDAKTESEVGRFQEFYKLTGIGLVTKGVVNVSTMKSLLTSKGDVNRIAKACDCATVLNRQQALDLKNAGYTHVGRYLTGSVGSDYIPKFITLDEVKNIENAGLRVFPIYQDGGYELKYFENLKQGNIDAQVAILAAERIGVPENTTIYFAVDFDCYGYQIDKYIIPYFSKIKMLFNSARNTKNYQVGIYAPRYVCTKVSELGLASTSFVADMSTGFSCNLGYKIPENWAFDQFYEMSFQSSPSFPIDKDAYSGRDSGIRAFDKVPEKSPSEIEKENEQALLEVERQQFVYDVMEPLGYLNKIIELGVSYNEEKVLGTHVGPEGTIEITGEISKEIKAVPDTDYTIPITYDNEGNLSAGFKNQVAEITTELKNAKFENAERLENILTNIGFSVESGNISLSLKPLGGIYTEYSITISSDNLLPEGYNIEDTISVTIKFKFTLNKDRDNRFDTALVVTGAVAAAAVGGILLACLAPEGVVAYIIYTFSTVVSSLGKFIIKLA